VKLHDRHLRVLHLAATVTAPGKRCGCETAGMPGETAKELAAAGLIEMTVEPARNSHQVVVTSLGLAAFYMNHPRREPRSTVAPAQPGAGPGPASPGSAGGGRSGRDK
jgi:hypothetical protein